MNTIAIIVLVLKVSLFLTALGFGLKTTLTNVLYLFRKPGLLVRSVLAMNLIMPAIAVLIAYNFKLPHLVKVTLIAVSVSPLAPLFPKKPLKSGGQEAYVAGLMLLASVFSILLIPVTLNVLSSLIHKPVAFALKGLAITLLGSVIIPLVSGIAFRYFAPAITLKSEPVITRIAQVLLVLSVIPILVKMFPAIIHLVGNGTVLAIVAFVFAGMFVGHFMGGPEQDNRTVLAFATSSRHPAVAMSLATANLPNHSHIAAAILLYLLINAIASLPYLTYLQRCKISDPGK